MSLTVITPEKNDRFPVFCQYPGNFEAQPAYILLDCKEEKLYADHHHGDRYVVPANVYYGHVVRWEIPADTSRRKIVKILKLIQSIAEEIIDGYATHYDGDNYYGQLSDEAEKARDEAQELIGDILDA